MTTRTLGEIVDAIQRTADVVAFTDRHPVSYIKDLACRGLGALQTLTATTDPEFRPVGSTQWTTDGITGELTLPVDCRSIIAVQYTVDGSKTFLEPFEWAERPQLADTSISNPTGRAAGFQRLGTSIELLPVPVANHTVKMWYATTVQQPSADADPVDVYDRLDSYVIWWAAREIADERENWQRVASLTTKMQALEADIRILARSRDISTPTRIIDRRNLRRARSLR